MTTTVTTLVKNTSGITKIFGFLPPHGRTLTADETAEFIGDIYSSIAANTRKLQAFQRSVAATDLTILSTPSNPAGGEQYKKPVQDLAALRAIAAADRTDKDVVLVEDTKAFYRFDATGTGTDDGDFIIAPTAGTGRWFKASIAANRIVEQTFTPTSMQTIFTLSQPYSAGDMALVSLNGVIQDVGVNFTIAGTTLTWLDVPTTLGPTDSLSIRYQAILP